MKRILLFASILAFSLLKAHAQEPMHKFAALPYAYDALEPYIDKTTMEIHYDRHHRAYYNNFMTAIKGTALENMPIKSIFSRISSYSAAIRNNGGGYWNHEFFWNCMKPNGGGHPSGELLSKLNATFGSFDEFKKQFADAGVKRFGSGWVWLAVAADGSLFITSTANQDNPLMNTDRKKGEPLLALDVWEHAYYLKYQNKRADYINNFWNVVNWDFVQKNYLKAPQQKLKKK